MTTLDIIGLVVYLLMILAMGWFLRVRRKTHAEYFLAGRRMGWFPIAISVMVTAFSAINFVALPNEVFGYGLYVLVALPIFFLAAWPITKIWMPFFHDMQLTSAYEYLERRFDIRVRMLASTLFIFWRILWMAIALYASAKIMAALTGQSMSVIIITGGLVATVYTFMGGIRAVMWTDVLQFFVLFGGILLGLHYATGDVGLKELFEIAHEGGRLKPFLPFDPSYLSFDPRIRMTFWSGLIGVFVAFLSRYGADQVIMQRYFSARSLKAAQKGLWLNALIAVISLSALAFFGLAIYAHAVQSGSLPAMDWSQVSPLQRKALAMKELAAVIRGFPPGVTGLVVAGLLAATMSSVDSGINACSAAFITDFYQRFQKNRATHDDAGFRLSKTMALGFGFVITLLALLLIPLVGRTQSLFMIVNKLINGLGSPLLVLFLLGMFSRRANAPGLFYGGLLALPLSLAAVFCVRPLALQYYAVLTLIVSILPCYIFSLLASSQGFCPAPASLQWTWLAWRQKQRETKF